MNDNDENWDPNGKREVSISKKGGRYVNQGFLLRLDVGAKDVIKNRKRRGGFKKSTTRKRRKTHRGYSYGKRKKIRNKNKNKNKNKKTTSPTKITRRRDSSLSSSPSSSFSSSSSSPPSQQTPPQQSSTSNRVQKRQKKSIETPSQNDKPRKFKAQVADLQTWRDSWKFTHAPEEKQRIEFEELTKVRGKRIF